MKLILGLDLGPGAIGWGVICYSEVLEELKVLGLGVRQISIDGDTLSNFKYGKEVKTNSNRTSKRTTRKLHARAIIRRNLLTDFFKNKGISISQSMMGLGRIDLWRLRAEAVSQEISAEQLARVLYHINQKRGYRASRFSNNDEEGKKPGQYVSDIKSRYTKLKDAGLTVGGWAYANISADHEFRIKDEIFPREAYIDEFNAIVECQRKYHPELLTEKAIKYLRDYIIFYQRPLKSCKHLVSPCEFELQETVDKDGHTIKIGPKVTHRSNPLFQLSRIWQSVNNIELADHNNVKFELEQNQRKLLISYLCEHEDMPLKKFNELLFGAKERVLLHTVGDFGKGLKGDSTRIVIKKALNGKYPKLLEFKPKIIDSVDKKTGEVRKIISPTVVDTPYYRLWHVLYSISDPADLKNTLKKQFGIEDEVVLENLSNIDFVKQGYGNMSVKAIKHILPYLMEGYKYSEACQQAGYRHSGYLTKEENEARPLQKSLQQLRKGSLRQPIVEKVLNQMVNLVNDLMDKYGEFDEIVVELARELKSSREERYETAKRNKRNEDENAKIADIIRTLTEEKITPTKLLIEKYKLWEESNNRCIYCGNPVNVMDFLHGIEADRDHIIPQSVLFDDSFANKVCSHKKCNNDKGNLTARDYMEQKGEDEFKKYVIRINELKLSKAKHDRLMWKASDIPEDFISRQLNETCYITRKAVGILNAVCRNVHVTTGSITAYLRHVWGWDTILHSLNIERYRIADKIKVIEHSHNGRTWTEERIKGWSKRLDHRHHAIDALTIACTTQGFIQRLNHLNTLKDKPFAPFFKQDSEHLKKQKRLEKFALSLPHFSTAEVRKAVDSILISIKPITKLVTPGKHYIKKGRKRILVQSGIIVPRGELHNEKTYGKIRVLDNKKCYSEKYVIKIKLTEIKPSNIKNIVDPYIRNLISNRLNEYEGKPEKAFAEPLYSDVACTKKIRSVRCYLNGTLVPVRKDRNGKLIGYAAPDANHHAAIYIDKNGKLIGQSATFIHCVERRRFGIQAIIIEPQDVWNDILLRKQKFRQEFKEQLPQPDWKFVLSLQRNEMFVLGMSEDEYQAAIKSNNKAAIAKYLYRVQRLSGSYYCFSRHTETSLSDFKDRVNKPEKRFISTQSLISFIKLNPHKIRINRLGEIEER